MIDRMYHPFHLDSGSGVKSYLVRMLTYLPGRPIAEVAISHQQLYEIGRLAAQLDKALEVRSGVLFVRDFVCLSFFVFVCFETESH
jgi:hypothetical protein